MTESTQGHGQGAAEARLVGGIAEGQPAGEGDPEEARPPGQSLGLPVECQHPRFRPQNYRGAVDAVDEPGEHGLGGGSGRQPLVHLEGAGQMRAEPVEEPGAHVLQMRLTLRHVEGDAKQPPLIARDNH